MLTSSKVLNGINGIPKIPGDKSISHRSIIIPAIAKGVTEITNILKSTDVLRTINAFKLMGIKIEQKESKLIIYGKGLNSLSKPLKKIDLGNSGTSARLLIGLLSAQNFNSYLLGDSSLTNRPMDRIIKPLQKMGANIESENNKLPIIIKGQNLNKIHYDLDIPSAQVKSGIVLAALFVKDKTIIIEKNITRNHTEIMLQSFDANIEIKKINNNNYISIKGQKELHPNNIDVPSDFSSAAFFIVATIINENSKIEMKNINLNPTRIGFLTAIRRMGGKININNEKEKNGEIIADIQVKSSKLEGCELDNNIAKKMIDEFPILAIAASFANSPSIFKGLEELRIKESNRLELIRYNLLNCGIFCKIIGNDLLIDPTKKIKTKTNIIKTNSDHRIAMAFAIMGTKLGINLEIQNAEYIKTSFPNFTKEINSLGGCLSE
jgi:3-phosphoshikimate 1-carboxyvinyltransferase